MALPRRLEVGDRVGVQLEVRPLPQQAVSGDLLAGPQDERHTLITTTGVVTDTSRAHCAVVAVDGTTLGFAYDGTRCITEGFGPRSMITHIEQD